MADDHGCMNLTCQGNKLVETSHLERLAKRHPGEVSAQLQSAHELALGQAISAPDRADARAFIEQNSDGSAAADQAALAEYCHVLLNANGFLYVD